MSSNESDAKPDTSESDTDDDCADSDGDSPSDSDCSKPCREIVPNDSDGQCCWLWNRSTLTNNARMSPNGREVLFHPSLSRGTAAVRSCTAISEGVCTWSVRMGPSTYGTDMVLGVCTEELDLSQHINRYKSLVGDDEHGWGLSYRGVRKHNGIERPGPHSAFGANAVVTLQLDTSRRRLSVSVDGSPMKAAFDDVCGRGHCPLYPVVCSTAASTRIRLQRSELIGLSLAHICLRTIRYAIRSRSDIDELPLPTLMKSCLKSDWINSAPPSPAHADRS